MITFDEYQNFTRTVATYGDDQMSLMYPVLGLAEEAGELVGKYAKYLRDRTDFPHDAVLKELGDVMWMVARISDDMGVNLSDIARINVEKLVSRQERGVLAGSGDNR